MYRRLSLSRSNIDTYKYQQKVLKTFYYNINHIEEIEMDDQDKLIVDCLAEQGRIVYHIFHSRGMVEYAPNKKDWMMRRAYVFINRVSKDPKINSTSQNEVGEEVLDAFIICEPIATEISGALVDGVFSTVNLARIKNLQNEEKVIWNF